MLYSFFLSTVLSFLCNLFYAYLLWYSRKDAPISFIFCQFVEKNDDRISLDTQENPKIPLTNNCIVYFMTQWQIEAHARTLRTGVTTVYLQYSSNKRTAWRGNDLVLVLLDLFPETKRHKSVTALTTLQPRIRAWWRSLWRCCLQSK